MAAVTKSKDRDKGMADDEVEATPAESRNRSGGGAGRSGGGSGDSGSSGGKGRSGGKSSSSAGGSGFFTIYKKGHGYWTRMGTAIGAGGLGVVIAFEFYAQIPTFLHGEQRHDQHVALLAAVVFLATWSLWAWWFTNKQTTAEFLIATDSEMKKVNWTSRKELIASTKIVIGFVFFVALFLFSCDLLFGAFFHLIGVLKTIF
jgi:preprotein translocase subunit SecE